MLHFFSNNSFKLYNSKKHFIVAIITLTLVLFSGCAGQTVQAETTSESDKANQAGQSQELELNDEVLHGRLDNGISYYIRANSRPKDRLQLRLVVDAGSILEQDDQRGLAHFVEHMAFNGTEKYEKDSIIDYLEKTGMSFGPDINASTSFDQTIYKLDLPTGDSEQVKNQEENQEENTVAKGVDILKEWAFRIAFAPEQVEDEKGVVIEEWRGARGAAARMREEYLPVLFRNSRYAERLPIGKMEVIRSADPEDLEQFYSAWYRPELMAVVAVGDMEPEKIEALIKETFSGAGPRDTPRDTPQDNAAERPSYSVPPAEGHEFAIVTDPEAQRTQIQMLSLHEPFRIKTEQDYRTSLVSNMYGQMIRARLSEKTEQSNPPYVNGYFGVTNYLRNNDATVWGALAREGQVERALRTLLEEERRISKFGFTEGELQRAKENLRSRMQRVYEERDKTESRSFAGEYVRHFLAGEAAPGIEREWELTLKYLPEISLEDIHRVREHIIRSGGAKTTIVTGPEKDDLEYPSPEELRKLVDQVQTSQVEPYRDDFSGRELIDKLPEPGSIESTETITIQASIVEADENISYHEFTLSNGAKVVYRQTDYKNEQVLFSAFSYGGASLVEDEDYYAAVMAPSFIQAAGLGEYSPSDLRKLTAGKQAQVRPTIGELTEGFSGSARPEDLGLLFQQVYLYFTTPRRDSDLFQSYQQRLQGVLQNRRSNPDVLLNDTVTKLLFDDHPRRQPYTAERIGEITEEQVYRIFSERFASPADFTFTFVGNLDPQKLKRLAAIYLGSIEPAASTDNRESWVNRGVRFTDTGAREEVYAGIAEKSRVNRLYFGSYDWSLEHNSSLESLRKLLEIRLREKVREEAGGTYGVGVSVSTSRDPVNRYLLSITFNCDPARVEELNSIIDSELSALAERPVEADYIEKVRSTRSSSLEEALETNGFWLDKLQSIQRYRLEPENALAVGSRIQATSADSLHRAARSYLSEATTLRAILYPESARE